MVTECAIQPAKRAPCLGPSYSALMDLIIKNIGILLHRWYR